LLLGAYPAAAVPLAPVEAFAKAWKKIHGAPRAAQTDLRAVAAKHPELADLCLFGQAAALQATDPAQAMRVYDSLSGLSTNPVATLARESAAELRYLGAKPPDTTEIGALREVLSKDLRSPARVRLRRRLALDLALARRYAEVDSLFQIRLTETVPLKDVREGLALLAPDTARLSSDVLRFAVAKAMFAVDRSDTARILLDSLAARRNLTSPEWVLRGRILLDLGKAPEAIAAFRKAVEDPREEQAFLWLARGLERVGRLADAQEAQLEFARRWPRSTKAQEILWGRGMDAEREGNCAEATHWYNRVKDGGGKRADWARFREGYC